MLIKIKNPLFPPVTNSSSQLHSSVFISSDINDFTFCLVSKGIYSFPLYLT